MRNYEETVEEMKFKDVDINPYLWKLIETKENFDRFMYDILLQEIDNHTNKIESFEAFSLDWGEDEAINEYGYPPTMFNDNTRIWSGIYDLEQLYVALNNPYMNICHIEHIINIVNKKLGKRPPEQLIKFVDGIVLYEKNMNLKVNDLSQAQIDAIKNNIDNIVNNLDTKIGNLNHLLVDILSEYRPKYVSYLDEKYGGNYIPHWLAHPTEMDINDEANALEYGILLFESKKQLNIKCGNSYNRMIKIINTYKNGNSLFPMFKTHVSERYMRSVLRDIAAQGLTNDNLHKLVQILYEIYNYMYDNCCRLSTGACDWGLIGGLPNRNILHDTIIEKLILFQD